LTETLRIALLHDGALELRVAESLMQVVDAWLPFSAFRSANDITEASITLREGSIGTSPCGPTSLRLGDVSVWVDDERSQVALHSMSGCVSGHIDLSAHSAMLVATTDSRSTSIVTDVYTMLTLSAALLLNRQGKALVHAAAVAPVSGPAWLLVGDTHAGKTTTTVNLITAGWKYLSDDHVVLSDASSGDVTAIVAEGWPRTFHLDDGWFSGIPGGTRTDTDPRTLAPTQWRSCAILGGLLFPTVVRSSPTRLEPLSQADALVLLLRQSPWLVADHKAAPTILGLLKRAAQLPARRLFLGMDTFRDPALLLQCLAPLLV
jgi:hypothetical protein